MSLEGQERQRDIKAKEKKAADLAKAEIDRPEAFERTKIPTTKPKKKPSKPSPEIEAATVREQTAMRAPFIPRPPPKTQPKPSKKSAIPASKKTPVKNGKPSPKGNGKQEPKAEPKAGGY